MKKGSGAFQEPLPCHLLQAEIFKLVKNKKNKKKNCRFEDEGAKKRRKIHSKTSPSFSSLLFSSRRQLLYLFSILFIDCLNNFNCFKTKKKTLNPYGFFKYPIWSIKIRVDPYLITQLVEAQRIKVCTASYRKDISLRY